MSAGGRQVFERQAREETRGDAGLVHFPSDSSR